MNYKEEIKRMASRVPQKVMDGDINKAELVRAYEALRAYE